MAKTKQLSELKVDPIDLNSAKVTVGLDEVWVSPTDEALIVQRSDVGHIVESDLSKLYNQDTIISSVVAENPLTVQHAGDRFSRGDIVHLYDKSSKDIGRHIVVQDTSDAGEFVLYGAASIKANGYYFLLGGWLPDDGNRGSGSGVVSDNIYRSSDGVTWVNAGSDERFGRVFATASNRTGDSFYYLGGYTPVAGASTPTSSGATYYDTLLIVDVDGGGSLSITEGPTNSSYEKHGIMLASFIGVTPKENLSFAHGTQFKRLDDSHNLVDSSFSLPESRIGGIILDDYGRQCTTIVMGSGRSAPRLVMKGDPTTGSQRSPENFNTDRSARILANTVWSGSGITYNARETNCRVFDVATGEEVEPVYYHQSGGVFNPLFNANVDAVATFRKFSTSSGKLTYYERFYQQTSFTISHGMNMPSRNLLVECYNDDGEQEEPLTVSFDDDDNVTLTFNTQGTRNIYITSTVSTATGETITEGWDSRFRETFASTSETRSISVKGVSMTHYFEKYLGTREESFGEWLEPDITIVGTTLQYDFNSPETWKSMTSQTRLPQTDGEQLLRDSMWVADEGDYGSFVSGFGEIAEYDVISDGSNPTISAVLSDGSNLSKGTTVVVRGFDSTETNSVNMAFLMRAVDVSADIPDSYGGAGLYVFQNNALNDRSFRHMICGGKHSYFTAYLTSTYHDATSETDPISLDGTDVDLLPTVLQTAFYTESRLDLDVGTWRIGKGSNQTSGVEVVYNSIEEDITALNNADSISFYDHGLDRLMLPGALRLDSDSNTSKLAVTVPLRWGETFSDNDDKFTGFSDSYFKGAIVTILRDQGSDVWSTERTRVVSHGAVPLTGGTLELALDPNIEIAAVSSDDFIYVTKPVAETIQYMTAGISSLRTDADDDDPSFLRQDGFVLQFDSQGGTLNSAVVVPSGFLGDFDDNELNGLVISDSIFADPASINTYEIASKSGDTINLTASAGTDLQGKTLQVFQYQSSPPALNLLKQTDYYFGSELPGMYVGEDVRSSALDKFCRLSAMEAKRNKSIAANTFFNDPRRVPREHLIELCHQYGVRNHQDLDEETLRRLGKRYYSEVVKHKGTLQAALNLYSIVFDQPYEYTGDVTRAEDVNGGTEVEFTLNDVGDGVTNLEQLPAPGSRIEITGTASYDNTYIVGSITGTKRIRCENLNAGSGIENFSPASPAYYSIRMVNRIPKTNPAYAVSYPFSTQFGLSVSAYNWGASVPLGLLADLSNPPSVYTRASNGYLTNGGESGGGRGHVYVPARPGDYMYISHEYGLFHNAYEVRYSEQDGGNADLWDYSFVEREFGTEADNFDSTKSAFWSVDFVTHTRAQYYLKTLREILPHYISNILVRFDG